MFVTSTTVRPDMLGGLTGAGTACSTAAQAGHLPDVHYVAYLSSSSIDAATRLEQARGWQRPGDHLPIADTIERLRSGQLLYPPRLDETGNPVPENTVVLTATNAFGSRLPDTCADFTLDNGTVEVGAPDGAGNAWSTNGVVSCSSNVHLYCLGISKAVTIPPMQPAGRIGFVTTDVFSVTDAGSVTALDAFCTAQSAGMSGVFKAFVAVGTSPPNARFDLTRGPWYRLDGVAFANQTLQSFDAPLHQDAHGDYIERDVLFGSTGPTVPTSAGNCADWSQSGASTSTGDSGRSSSGAFVGQTLLACGTGANLYCLEQ